MSTTITLPTVELKSVTRALASDWAPTLHTTARRIAAVLAAVYTVWVMAKERWHQLVAWAVEHELQGLARLGLPGGNVKALLTGSTTEESSAVALDHFPAATKMVVQRQALALPPARSAANVAPPRTGIIHISDPMARAVRMVRDGKSQRLAAQLCGVSRTSLQRALKA